MNQETFGSYIRKLREGNNMPLRKLAAYLDIDQSTLSKIETNQRQPTKEMIPILSKVFKVKIKELKIKYLSEKILYQIQGEEHGLDALKVVEEAINYPKTRKK
ncbi:MAG: helix-turn-helix transcriptional regulator [Parafilimonas sp.]